MEAVSRHGTHWPRPDDENDSDESLGKVLRPPWLQTVQLCLVILLTVTTALTLVYAVRVESRLNQAEADRVALRAARDQQLAEMDQKFCDMLDRLPAGPLLDPVRDRFGCIGLGVPASELDPAAREQLRELADNTPQPLRTAPPQTFDPSVPPSTSGIQPSS